MMRLILRMDVQPLGKRGDVVKVAPGYGRNFLLPKGMAYEYSDANVKRIEKERKILEIVQLKEKQEAEGLARRIAAVSCTIVKKVGENDTLYGSVTTGDIADALAARDVTVDRRKIQLDEPLKTLGDHVVPVRLHRDVTAQLKLRIVPAT
jgi:large subunit ribosomal protein L9